MVKEKIPERDRADAAGGEEMKKKKNKINYNFTKRNLLPDRREGR
ncbi:MAG: hypothetical protein ACLUPF_04500 [Dorea sp.]